MVSHLIYGWKEKPSVPGSASPVICMTAARTCMGLTATPCLSLESFHLSLLDLLASVCQVHPAVVTVPGTLEMVMHASPLRIHRSNFPFISSITPKKTVL